MPRSKNRISIEVPLPLHAALRDRADQEGMTIATAAVIAIREWLARDEDRDRARTTTARSPHHTPKGAAQ